MLKQYQFYVYHEGADVYARRGEEERVLAETCATPADAYAKVQSILNPDSKAPEAFGAKGFNSDEFKNTVSDNCRDYVTAAYTAAGQ